jgi:CofD-related protein of GAK system
MIGGGMKPVRLEVCRHTLLPDAVRLARFAKSPELGPRLLFFSGGTAIRELSRTLIGYTHNSIHVMTPFDSGGSSAVLRRAFGMPAVGDVRNRLMALADQSLTGNPEIYALFAHRLPKEASPQELEGEFTSMAEGGHPLVQAIPDPMRKIIRHHLGRFAEFKPQGFDLSGASIGNLVLTAGYLDHSRHLDPVIFVFSKLVAARGVVRPVVNEDLQLVSLLENGERVVGQHLITGKECPPIESRVERLYLAHGGEPETPVQISIRDKMRELIASAEMICYPMGSFYSSIVANILPGGVGSAVAANHGPKVFVPNTMEDPECRGLTLPEQVEVLLEYLRADDPDSIQPSDVLGFVLLDENASRYNGELDEERMKVLGIRTLRCSLVSRQSEPFIDAGRIAAILLSLA